MGRSDSGHSFNGCDDGICRPVRASESGRRLFVCQAFLMDNRKLPMIVAAFGLLIIFSQIHFRNGMIYRIASAAFDVYLVSDSLLSVSCCSKKVHSEQGLQSTMCAGPAGRAWASCAAGVRRMHHTGLTVSTVVPRGRGPAVVAGLTTLDHKCMRLLQPRPYGTCVNFRSLR